MHPQVENCHGADVALKHFHSRDRQISSSYLATYQIMRKLDQDFKSIWRHFTEYIPPLILDFTVFAGSYTSKLIAHDSGHLYSFL